MDGVTIRLAVHDDVDEFVAMRREFTFEDVEPPSRTSRPEFDAECRAFLADAIAGGRWQIWVAEHEARIVAHAFVALVDKVPRPTRANSRIAYLTNVYRRPELRGRGIGTSVLAHAQDAARESAVELVIVRPSDESVGLYERLGFDAPDEPLIWEAG